MRRQYRLVALALLLAATPLAIAQQAASGSGASSNPLGRSGLNTGFPPVLSAPLSGPPVLGPPPSAIQRATPVTPVPEPSEWLLMLTGLGVVGAIARRRSKRS